MEDIVLTKLKEAKTSYEFVLFEEKVAKLDRDDVFVYIKYFEEDDSFMVFDGGYTIAECVEKYLDDEVVAKKAKKILEKYKVNKEKGEEPLFIECKLNELQESIVTLIKVEREILSL